MPIHCQRLKKRAFSFSSLISIRLSSNDDFHDMAEEVELAVPSRYFVNETSCILRTHYLIDSYITLL